MHQPVETRQPKKVLDLSQYFQAFTDQFVSDVILLSNPANADARPTSRRQRDRLYTKLMGLTAEELGQLFYTSLAKATITISTEANLVLAKDVDEQASAYIENLQRTIRTLQAPARYGQQLAANIAGLKQIDEPFMLGDSVILPPRARTLKGFVRSFLSLFTTRFIRRRADDLQNPNELNTGKDAQ